MFDRLKNKIHILQNIYIKNKYFIKRKSYAMDGEDIAIEIFNKKKDKGFLRRYWGSSSHPTKQYLIYYFKKDGKVSMLM